MRAHVAAALLAAAAAWVGEPLLPPLPPAVAERAGIPLGSRWNPHRVSAAQFQNAWTPFAKPVLTVASGAVVEVDALDASGGQLTQDSTVADLAAVDFARLNPVHGPVFVAGAEVGDVLRVEVLRIAPAPFAWTAVFPGFGLLADAGELSVTGPALVKATLPSWPFLRWLRFAGVWVPLSPHVGSMGVAPPVSRGALSTIPPDVHGGNLDTRHVTAGSVALFPVHTPGALFYLGDVHAGQGDGEVCGTALEVAAKVTVRLHVLKRSTPDAAAVTEWQLRTPAWLPLHPGRDGARFITTGFAPDLLTASRKAIRHMMDVLRAKRPEMTTEEAYMVCSISADLRVSQAVDMPHFSVAAHLPAGVLAD